MSEINKQWKEQGVIVPAAKSPALAVNGGSPVGAYLAQHGVGTGGVFIKFAKEGVYRKQADDAQIPTGTEVAVVYDEIRVGWIKFLEKGQQPERKMGPVFSGFVPPGREELGDLDDARHEERRDVHLRHHQHHRASRVQQAHLRLRKNAEVGARLLSGYKAGCLRLRAPGQPDRLGTHALLHPHREGAEIGHVDGENLSCRQHERRHPVLGAAPARMPGNFSNF
jgi:hypothetical protein